MIRPTTLTQLAVEQAAPSILITFLLLFGIFSKPLMAAHSPLGYAYPVEPLQIDGDLSDWPKSIPTYRLDQIPFGKAAENDADFKAHFQVAYNLAEQFLYVGMKVVDDAHFIDTSKNASWNNQDIHNLYIDRKHLYSGSGVNLFVYNDQFKDIVNATTSWDPEAKNAKWESIKVKSKCEGNTCVYEWRIHLPGQLSPGKTIGIDHVVTDRDPGEDDSNFLSWSSGGGKSRAPGRLGDVLLMKADEAMGVLSGQLRWKDASIKGYTGKIKLTSVSNPACWTVVEVDSTGRYNAQLPEGKYRVSLYWNLYYDDEDNIHRMDDRKDMVMALVKANKKVEAPILHLSSLPTPNKIPAKGILHDFNTQRIAELDQFIDDYQRYYEIPGVSLALIKDGKVVYHQTYGTKNSFTNEPVDENTLFEAASVTKPVFGFVVCRLAERGLIDLDKPLYQYLPFEAIAHDERYQLITARHVLSHQTGFPNWAWMNDDGKIDIKFTPGTAYGYSGEGFEYLKRVVAHITGKDIGLVLKEEVLEPLQLKNTYFAKNDYLQKVVAHGHNDNRPTVADLPGRPGMAWSMHTEAKSFSRFILALFNQEGMKSESYAELFRPQIVIPKEQHGGEEEESFGLGIHLSQTPQGLAFGHGGNNGDFKCKFTMYKDLNMGFAVFTNSNTGDELHAALEKYLIKGKKAEKKQ